MRYPVAGGCLAAVLASDLTLGRREESCVERLLQFAARPGRQEVVQLAGGPVGSRHMAGTIAGPALAATSHWLSNSRRVPECACSPPAGRIGPGPGPAEVNGSRRVVLIFPQSSWDDLA
jgi:hypothetical protein